MSFYIHIIEGQKKLGAVSRRNVPRVGDEIRWTPSLFFKVVRVVHCFDEKAQFLDEDRVNIEVERVE
jgi:hypothetical protein